MNVASCPYCDRPVHDPDMDFHPHCASRAVAKAKEAAAAKRKERDKLKTDLAAVTAQRDRLAGLLLESKDLLDYYNSLVAECGIAHRIDAALAELEKNK